MCFFFFNDTATTEIYTLSLHDALPICWVAHRGSHVACTSWPKCERHWPVALAPGDGRLRTDRERPTSQGILGSQVDDGDRKSTRLNSSHANISYAVFCLKKKN